MKEVAAIVRLFTICSAQPRRLRSRLAVGGLLALTAWGGLAACSDSADPAGQSGDPSAQSALAPRERMEQLAAKSGWEATLSKITHELSRAPGDTVWIALAARAEMEQANFDAAGPRLVSALAANPDDPALNTERGVFEYARASYTEAVRVLEPVVAKDAENARAQEFLGRALEFESIIMMGSRGIEMDVLGRSIDALEASVRYGETAERLVALGLALERAQRLDDAVIVFQRATDVDADHPGAWHGLARMSLEIGNLEEADRAFTQALRFGEGDADVWLSYGLLLEQQGDEAKAQMAYGNAIRRDVSLAKAYYRLSVLLGREGETQSAEKYKVSYERLQKLNDDLQGWRFRVRQVPEDNEAVFQLGIAYARLQKWSDALSWFERSTRSRPDDARAHYQHGRALFNLKRPSEAVRHLARAVKLNPVHLAAHRLLPQVANPLGEFQLASESFEAMTGIEPTNPDHWFNLGQSRRQVSTPQSALEAFDQCLMLKPDHLAGLEMVTRVELGLGRLEDARAHLDALLSYDSGHTVGQSLAQELGALFMEREEKQ